MELVHKLSSCNCHSCCVNCINRTVSAFYFDFITICSILINIIAISCESCNFIIASSWDPLILPTEVGFKFSPSIAIFLFKADIVMNFFSSVICNSCNYAVTKSNLCRVYLNCNTVTVSPGPQM